MTYMFTHDRQKVSPMRERRLIHLNIPDWHTDVTLQNGVRERKDSLNPLGFDRMDPNIRGLDQMIQATQQEYEMRQNMGEDTRRTQLYSIQKLWQDDYNMQVSDNFPSGNSLKIDKRSWLDAANAELADKGASYRLSIINDTVLPKPAPKVPKVTEGVPNAPSLPDDDGEKLNEDVPSTVDEAAPLRNIFDPKERVEITGRAKAMLDAKDWKTLSAADRNALVNSIKMTTGANVDLTDPETPILSAPNDRYERYTTILQGARDSADESFVDDTGVIGPKTAPNPKYEDNLQGIKRAVKLDDPEIDLELLNSFSKGTKDTTALIKRSKKEIGRLEDAIRVGSTPELLTKLAEQKDMLEKLKALLVGYQDSARILQELMKEREEKKEEDDALTKLDDDNKKIMEKVQKGDVSEVYRLTELNVLLAKMLVAVDDYLPLNGLAKLTPEVATVLSGHARFIMLNGLKELDEKSAEALGKRSAPTSLDGIPSLSPATARFLSAMQGSLDLNGVSEINELVAVELAKHSSTLDLNGITKMDELTAKALALHKGTVNLHGLVTIPDAGVAELAGIEGSLTLGIGPSLNLETAKALAKHAGERLSLPKVTVLGIAEAKVLGQRDGHLSLGLKTISPDVADALTAVSTKNLMLYSLTTLTPEVAEALAKHRGDLYLNGVQTIDENVAQKLAVREGLCEIDDVKEMKPEVAKALFADHPQRVSLNRFDPARNSPETAMIIAKNKGKITYLSTSFKESALYKDALAKVEKWTADNLEPAYTLIAIDKGADAKALEDAATLLIPNADLIKDMKSDEWHSAWNLRMSVEWHLASNPKVAAGTPANDAARDKLTELKSKL